MTPDDPIRELVRRAQEGVPVPPFRAMYAPPTPVWRPALAVLAIAAVVAVVAWPRPTLQAVARPMPPPTVPVVVPTEVAMLSAWSSPTERLLDLPFQETYATPVMGAVPPIPPLSEP